MKVLLVVPLLGVGGAENQLVQLAKWLRGKSHQVTVVSMIEPTAYVEQLKKAGADVISMGMSRGMPDPQSALQFRSIVRKLKPDVLHAFGFPAIVMSRVVSRFVAKGPAVVSTGVGTKEMVGIRSRLLMYRHTDRFSDATTHVSSKTAEMAKEAGAVRKDGIEWIPCGTDMSAFSRPTAEEKQQAKRDLGYGPGFLWLAVGRLVKEKDYVCLLDAFVEVRKTNPTAKLVIRGMGELEGMLRDAIGERKLDEIVELNVQKDVNIPKLMKAADGYVMSSIEEGLPVVLVEAAASGLPLVSTDVGGTSDVVVNGQTGLLTPPSAPALLAAAMCQIMDMPEGERSAMGRRGRELAEGRFDMETVASNYVRIYQSALKRRGRPAWN